MTAAALARPLPLRRVADQRHAQVQTAHVRLMMVLLMFAALVTLVVGKLVFLAAFTEPSAVRDPDTMLAPAREDIVDRNGVPLARTISMWAIGVHPEKLIGDRHEVADKLAAIAPEHDAAWYLAAFTRHRFTYLVHRATPDLVNRINGELGQPGIVAEPEPMRLYPQGQLAAHVLGFVDVNGAGQQGLEKSLDARLADPAQRNQPLALSVDARVQGALESELGAAMTSFQAKGAAGVVMDVATGEVVALASFPIYNPNRPGDIGPKQFDAKGREMPNARYNRVTQAVYELGSTFKPIAVAAAIDSGTITSMARRFDATVPLKVGGFTIHDDRGDEQRRWLNIPETLIYSSNIATARIADELGKDKLSAMFRAFGFDKRPEIELPERSRPLWPSFWARTTVMTTAFGHGIAVTPLHLAGAYAALVNGGVWHAPTLLKVAPGHAPTGKRVLSEATSARMRQLLRLVVLRGTGRKGEAPGYRVGGKTGTAEVSTGGGYSRTANVATFAAAFPIDAPRYVVIAMLDSPIGNKESFGLRTAAWTAAPVVSHVIQRTAPLLGVMPDMTRDIDESDLLPLLWSGPGGPSKNAE